MEFKYFICLDLEATCHNFKKQNAEIIEIAAILLNAETGANESHFHRYVRPTQCPTLSAFCKKLTGIEQSRVDRSKEFSSVYKDFIVWLKNLQRKKHLRFASPTEVRASQGANATFCSWSNMDLKFFFRNECKRNNIICPIYFKAWIDISKGFEEIYGRGNKTHRKFSEALEVANIQAVGRAHSAFFDATNLVTLVMHLIDQGLTFGVTTDHYH